MFGDPLSKAECSELLTKLSKCRIPFQCAHGRPSFHPLISLKKIPHLRYKPKRTAIPSSFFQTKLL